MCSQVCRRDAGRQTETSGNEDWLQVGPSFWLSEVSLYPRRELSVKSAWLLSVHRSPRSGLTHMSFLVTDAPTLGLSV
jgi:hypothetical protein